MAMTVAVAATTTTTTLILPINQRSAATEKVRKKNACIKKLWRDELVGGWDAIMFQLRLQYKNKQTNQTNKHGGIVYIGTYHQQKAVSDNHRSRLTRLTQRTAIIVFDIFEFYRICMGKLKFCADKDTVDGHVFSIGL